ncbi:MAG: hypothetical protein ACYTG6_03470 [Planctomycetota bacterium]|jgi:DNA-binding NarL/FixJ family response regulator
MAPRATALLVAPPGPGRRQTATALKAAGFRVRGAAEPYEGTARFVESPADLVVLSLAVFGPRDRGFFRTVRRRAPRTRILLLVPEGRRRAAVAALRAGAHAWIPEPAYPEEVQAIATSLVPVAQGPATAGPALLRDLAGEVSHAVNNPLQILSLLGEESGVHGKARERLGTEVGRIRDVVRILDQYSRIGRPARVPGALGVVFGECLSEAVAAGRLRTVGPPPAEGRQVSFDPRQVRHALSCLLDVAAARVPEAPLPVKVRVHAVRHGDGRAVEAAVKGRGLRMGDTEFEALRARVLWTHDETRVSYPGLALPDAVAREHGGRLVARPGRGGDILALVLPAA